MKTRNYNVTLQIKDIPSDNEQAVVMELFDVLKAVQQLPYDFSCNMERNGSWL